MSQSFWREVAGWRRDLREACSPFLPGAPGRWLQLQGGRAGQSARASQVESGLGPLQGTNEGVVRSCDPKFSSSFVDIFPVRRRRGHRAVVEAPFAGSCCQHWLYHQLRHKSGLPDPPAL